MKRSSGNGVMSQEEGKQRQQTDTGGDVSVRKRERERMMISLPVINISRDIHKQDLPIGMNEDTQ